MRYTKNGKVYEMSPSGVVRELGYAIEPRETVPRRELTHRELVNVVLLQDAAPYLFDARNLLRALNEGGPTNSTMNLINEYVARLWA